MSEADSIVESHSALVLPTEPADKINFAEAAILANGGIYRPLGGTVECAPLKHHFTPGLYAREIFLPGDHVLTTYIHKQTHQFVILRGRVSIYNEQGEIITVEAPYQGVTRAGTRRFIRTHEDTVWVTFHPTDLTDINELEEFLFARWDNPYVLGIHKELKP
jgi:hypothetical protein